MKVELVNDHRPDAWHNPAARERSLPMKRSLPFYASPRGTRMHRIRSAELYRPLDRPHYLTVKLWCGQGGFIGDGRGSFHEDPIEGWPVCATCEGRAVGAGQLGSRQLTEREVIFTPVPGARIDCVWERRSHGYAWVSYSQCRGRASFIASRPGEEDRPTCRYCSRLKRTAEWTMTPIPAPFEVVA